jgi:WD40 repeat protein
MPQSFYALWLKLLENPLPIVGQWTQRFGLDRLAKALQFGDPQAVATLAAALASPSTAAVHPRIVQILSQPLLPGCRDRLWEEWAARRLSDLGNILAAQGQTAGTQSPAWAISHAWLGRLAPLEAAPAARIAELANLLADPDPQIAAVARAALTGLSQPASREELYRLWAVDRATGEYRLGTLASHAGDLWTLLQTAGYPAPSSPQLRVLYWLKSGNAEALLSVAPEMVPFLVIALRDPDPAMADLARRSLPFLQESAAIDALVALWHKERGPLLGEIVREGKLVASQPLQLRLLSALKAGRDEVTRRVGVEGLAILLNCLSDPDSQIVLAARNALLALERPAARTALCLQAIKDSHSPAAELALQGGYRPEKPEQRALFLFLFGLWDEYDALDFDQRLMRAIYETGAPELRQRIALQVQRSGRTPYLTILAGVDYRSRAADLAGDEAQLLVELLLANQEWARLWPLVHNLALPWSVRILQALANAGWQPESDAERREFATLAALVHELDVPTREELATTLPPAFARSVVRVRGRINDLSFAGGQPLVAIGSGAGKLAVWDFQKASLVRVRQGFNFPINRVAFVGSEYLVCGVRASLEAPGWIYAWQQDEPFVLNGHRGAVTALQAAGDTTLLSTGRDGAAVLWNLASRQEITRRTFTKWPRNVALASNGQQAALLHDSLSLITLPSLSDLFPLQAARRVNGAQTNLSVAKCATFTPDRAAVVVGDHSGQVVEYRLPTKKAGFSKKTILRIADSGLRIAEEEGRTMQAVTPKPTSFLDNLQSVLRNSQSTTRSPRSSIRNTQSAIRPPESSPITGLSFLPNRNILAIASRSGRIEFRRWPDLSLAGFVSIGEGVLTSLQISPDGTFMATGTGDSTMLFWDLRILDLPDLIELPLGQARPEHMAIVAGLLAAPALPERLRRPLELIKALLTRRFRFDIHLDELPQIQPGEFDILLD